MSDTISAIPEIMSNARLAFEKYSRVSTGKRAVFLETIAEEIENKREALVNLANLETNLPLPRLNGEIGRTTGQLKMFANLIKEGSWVEAVIDLPDAERVPAKPDTRKMLVPLGPVIVFGASNFPFAFSTAGGDTASALASGSTVVIKGHPAHAKTSEMVFEAIQIAIKKCEIPENTVQHVPGDSHETGKALVMHPLSTAVAFTGSQAGGKALIEYARQREIPVPVYAEMSSINPVVLLPETLGSNTTSLAKTFAGSVTLGMGQFCTKPGLFFALKGENLNQFILLLLEELKLISKHKMLHEGIAQAYEKLLQHLGTQQEVSFLSDSEKFTEEMKPEAIIAKVKAESFLKNPGLSEEIFGPYALIVECEDLNELKSALKSLKGQLTATIMGTDQDFDLHADIIELQTSLAGRVILNAAPTGVEVCASMVHGGGYPSTSDEKFTSVGSSSIKRWVRPVCFQGFRNNMLPDALKNENPLGIWRIIDNKFTQKTI